MLFRLSRYFSRSKRRKSKSAPIPIAPPQLPHPISNSPPDSPASSGHSSSCSIEPESAPPSFLQVVCNDSQPVYCMETIPLYTPSALPPGTRKATSLYESARDEILRERMKVTALENEAERNGVKDRAWTARADVRRERRNDTMRRWNSLRQQQTEERGHWGRTGYVPSFEERESDAEEYTSTDHYYGPPVYRDPPPRTSQDYSQQYAPAPSLGYMERDYARHFSSPQLPGPFRTQQHQQSYTIEPFPSPLSQHRDSIPAEPYFTRASSIRQGPYHLFQNPPPSPISPYHHPDFYNERHHREPLQRPQLDDMSEIPITRITRLKPSYKTFGREDGIRSDVGIGLGRISGMAPTRSVSARRGGTKSDIGIGTRSTSSHSQQPPEVQVFLSNCYSTKLALVSPITTAQRIETTDSFDSCIPTNTPRSHQNRQTHWPLQNLHNACLPSHDPRL